MAKNYDNDIQENIFWVTMTDLFLGMFLVFAVLFFSFVINTGQGTRVVQDATKEMTQEVVEQMQKKGIKVSIIDETKPNQPHSAIEMDPDTGLVRISDLQLFDINSAKLTPKGKEFLKSFIPVYFDTLYNTDVSKYVQAVIIQGHTCSTGFRVNYSAEEQYLKNMSLSMNRAYNVADYIFDLSRGKNYNNKLLKTIKVEGASSSSPVMIKGKEDYAKSRRVDLRLVYKKPPQDVLLDMIKDGGNYDDIR